MYYDSNVCLSTLLMHLSHLSVDGKDGAYGCQAVDVGGAIQWVKTHHIFTLQEGGGVKLTTFFMTFKIQFHPTYQPSSLN